MEKPNIYDGLNEFLLFFLLIFTPLAHGAVYPEAIAIIEIAAAVMVFFWILRVLSSSKTPVLITPILIPVFMLIAFACFQFFFSKSIYLWATKTEILKVIAYALIFFTALNTVKTRKQIRRFEILIITIGFFMSIFYLMRYFGAAAPRGFINPDHFSAYLGMMIPLSLGFFLIPSEDIPLQSVFEGRNSANRNKDDLWPLLIFFSIIMSAALFFTMSRGGMFSFMATILFVAFLVSRRRALRKKGWIFIVLVGFIMLMLAWLGATPVIERLLSIKIEITSLYFSGRLPIWQGTLQMIQDHPVFGTGLGTFNYIFSKYQPLENIMLHFTYAHSDIFELLAETGFAGFSLVGIGVLGSIIYLFRRYHKRHDPWVTAMSLCIFGSLTSIFLHSFTDFNLHIPANAVLLSVLLALLLSILDSKESHQIETANAISSEKESKITVSGVLPKSFLAIFLVILLVIYSVMAIRPALAHYRAYKKPGGIQGLGAAIRLDPLNAQYHYELGRLYGKSGFYTLQLARYKKAATLNPMLSEYHQSLAWSYGQKKNEAEAQKEFEKAIELIPNYYYPYQAYAEWLLEHPTKENVARGMALYQKAVALNPDLEKEALEDYRVLSSKELSEPS